MTLRIFQHFMDAKCNDNCFIMYSIFQKVYERVANVVTKLASVDESAKVEEMYEKILTPESWQNYYNGTYRRTMLDKYETKPEYTQENYSELAAFVLLEIELLNGKRSGVLANITNEVLVIPGCIPIVKIAHVFVIKSCVI